MPISDQPGPTQAATRAFTLIELLVVIAVIALLIGILLPALGSARNAGRRIACLSNIRSLGTAASAYANDTQRSLFIPSYWPQLDNLAWFFPDYIDQSSVAVCPSTANVVEPAGDGARIIDPGSASPGLRNLVSDPALNIYPRNDFLIDLFRSAIDKDDDGSGISSGTSQGGGHSYEVFMWQEPGRYPDGTNIARGGHGSVLTQNGFQSVDHRLPAGLLPLIQDPSALDEKLKTQTNLPFPSRVMIFADADNDEDPAQTGIVNAATARAIFGINIRETPEADESVANWPSRWNNHGESGLNAAKADGSARWYATGPELLELYLNSYEEFNDDMVRRLEAQTDWEENAGTIAGQAVRVFTRAGQ